MTEKLLDIINENVVVSKSVKLNLPKLNKVTENKSNNSPKVKLPKLEEV